MKNLLKFASLLGLLLLPLFFCLSCSNSTTNNNNSNNSNKPNLESETNDPNNVASKSLSGGTCERPANVYISNAAYQSAGNYILTYSWDAVPNATGYEFDFTINGNSAFQNPVVTDTFITFPQAISASDVIKGSVKTICSSSKSTNAKDSPDVIYKNSIADEDVIWRVRSSTNIGDICSKTCLKVKFEDPTLLNVDGTLLTLANFQMRTVFYDFNTIKNCIACNTGGSTPPVDPAAFNSCLSNPANQYWLYDPNAFKECN